MVRAFLTKFLPKSERRLLALCLNNPDNDQDVSEWNKNAVRYLVRELKKDLKLIDELERAISQKSSKSKCVTVPKTPDRRLLVSHRRGLPQVIYGRLWRWPDLQSHHQIKAIHTCESSAEYSSKGGVVKPGDSQRVCINPYHYERFNPKPIEPVLVPTSRIPPDLSTSFEDSDTTGETKGRPAGLSFLQHIAPYLHQNQDQPMAEDFEPVLSPQQQPAQPPPPPFYQPQPPQYQSPGPQVQQQHSPQYQATAATQQQQQQFLHSQSQAQYQMSPQAADYPRSQEIFSQSEDPQHYQQSQQAQGGQFATQTSQDAAYAPQQFQPGTPQTNTGADDGGGTVAGAGGGGGAIRVLQQRQLQQHQRQALHIGPEIARPFRFKQNRFAHMARARHDHGLVSRYPTANDPNCYNSYTYSSQPGTHAQLTYQQPFRPQQQQGGAVGQQQCTSPAQEQTYPNPYPASSVTSSQQAQQTRYAQTPSAGLTYSTMYPAQQQYSCQGQSMQIGEYQQDALMTVATQRPGEGETYYPNAVAGTSHTFVSPDQLMDQATAIDIQEVPYTEGAYWCSISYHEYDQRIGEKYHSNCRVVSVDGYTQPMCNDRFCIGGISNVNRDHFTEWVRRRIGRGVKVTYVDGEVYVEGLSEASVFVSNPLLVEEDGDHYIEHVSKLTLGCSAKVFSTQQFSELLTEAVAKGFEAVYKLTNCCVIRVSFVKGWGRNYKRQSIFRTPCWVEVQLNGPLQWIDKVLRQMRPPTGCGSNS